MAIHWFPGHMASARKEIRSAMPEMDLLVEVLDARMPFSSENPLVAELRGDKPSILLLNKSDLADPEVTAEWVAALESRPGARVVVHHRGQSKVVELVKRLARELVPAARHRPMATMILGIPNVGKSTVINALAGRSIAKASNRPGITQSRQRVAAGPDLVLWDTPGFLWPKLNPPACGYRLAMGGSVSERAFDYQDVAIFAASFLRDRYPAALRATYALGELPTEPVPLLEAVGRKRGFLVRGGGVDLQRAAERLLHDVRDGALGPLSFERPGDRA